MASLDRMSGLVVSCQPVVGGAMDRPEFVVGFALAAEAGGARGLRIEGLANLRAVRAATSSPIIGLIKRVDRRWPVIITPEPSDVVELAAAGADIVAFDATSRPRPAPIAAMIESIHAAGALAMADISSLDEARAAVAAGADIVGTTLAGYVAGAVPEVPNIDLVRACVGLHTCVFAEGSYRTPEQARAAMEAGARAVVIGSAITRPEHITGWFVQALNAGAR